MSTSTILGLAGDILTFTGGLVLALDALLRGIEFKKTKDLQKAVARLSGIELKQDGLHIFDDQSVEVLFIRRSVRRAILGTAIVASGFLSLLAARVNELATR